MPDAQIRDWLKLLAGLVGGSLGKDELQAKLGLYVPMLAAEFPPEAFTAQTLPIVARACRFFPSFAEICEALEPWMRQHRERRRYAIEYSYRSESTEPYDPGPAPDWCFDRGVSGVYRPRAKALYLTRGQLNEAYRREGLVGPKLPEAKVAPLRAAAADMPAEVKRGPSLVEDADTPSDAIH